MVLLFWKFVDICDRYLTANMWMHYQQLNEEYTLHELSLRGCFVSPWQPFISTAYYFLFKTKMWTKFHTAVSMSCSIKKSQNESDVHKESKD